MASSIDATKPVAGTPTTQSVRDNFSAAKSEIEALQGRKLDDLAAPDDNTDLNATTSAHGLSPKATAPASGSISALAIANGETARTDKVIFAGGVTSIEKVTEFPGSPVTGRLYLKVPA